MRIGIYDPYLDDLGGGEKYMMTIAECLSKEHDVSVFWNDKKDVENIVERFSLDLTKVSLKENIFSTQYSFLKRLFESKKYDVLIILSDGSIPYVLAKKIFLHIQQPLETAAVSSWKAKIKLKRIKNVFYNSQFTKSFNKNILPGVPTTVIYPPVQLFSKKTPKQNIILHVGRFRVNNVKNEDYKKQQLMVGVFKEMVDKGLKDWKFVVATSIQETSDERFQGMLSMAKGYPIEFEINRTNKDLWEIYNIAKIYWHASGFGEDLEKHPEYAEHFGISTVEAMGAGAVPVVINAGGQKEIVTEGENGFLWITLAELQKKTMNLLSNKNTWEKMSKQASIRAKEFSKEKFCNQLEKLIRD